MSSTSRPSTTLVLIIFVASSTKHRTRWSSTSWKGLASSSSPTSTLIRRTVASLKVWLKNSRDKYLRKRLGVKIVKSGLILLGWNDNDYSFWNPSQFSRCHKFMAKYIGTWWLSYYSPLLRIIKHCMRLTFPADIRTCSSNCRGSQHSGLWSLEIQSLAKGTKKRGYLFQRYTTVWLSRVQLCNFEQKHIKARIK